MRSLITTSGQAATKTNYKKWQWAAQMEHFKPYLKFASTSSNVQPPDDSADHSDPENSAENNMEPEAIEDTELNTELADILPSVSTPKKTKTGKTPPKIGWSKKETI